MKSIQPLNGQSNVDLVLQSYGSIDKLIQLCIDNNVNSVTIVEKIKYNVDENSVVNRSVIGYKYVTSLVGFVETQSDDFFIIPTDDFGVIESI